MVQQNWEFPDATTIAYNDTWTISFTAPATQDCTMATLTGDSSERPPFYVDLDATQNIDVRFVDVQPVECGAKTYLYKKTGPADTDFMVYDSQSAYMYFPFVTYSEGIEGAVQPGT